MKLFPVYLFSLFTLLSRIYVCLAGPHPRCEKIVAPICRGLGYNTTSMPNFVGHSNQEDAIQGLMEFESLLNHKCSSYLRLFVCSVYVPLCSEHVPGAVPACRGLCEEVKKDCIKDIEDAGFSWPEQLDCSRFPEPPKLCMQKPPKEESHIPLNNDFLPIRPIEGLTANICPIDSIPSDHKCLKRCNADNRYPKNDQFLYEVWSAVWSILSMLLTKFALVTFFIQPKRFRWPARPILYLTVCGYVTSLVYFVRWMLGPFTCAGEVLIEQAFDNPICICSALILTYCDFAFCLWWCVFCFVWYLSASKEWSTEALEKLAPRLHGIIWTVSFVPIIYALISSNIRSNFFTGFCEVNSYFVTNVQIFFLIVGAVLAVITSVALRNVRQALIYAGRSPYKLERLICRLGVICLGIFIPLLAGLLCYYFDSLSVSLIKVALRYLSVIFASLWVFSSKTFKSWNKILKPAFTSKGLRNAPVTKV